MSRQACAATNNYFFQKKEGDEHRLYHHHYSIIHPPWTHSRTHLATPSSPAARLSQPATAPPPPPPIPPPLQLLGGAQPRCVSLMRPCAVGPSAYTVMPCCAHRTTRGAADVSRRLKGRLTQEMGTPARTCSRALMRVLYN